MDIKQLNEDNFNEVISSETKPIIIDFYADWCGPCKMMAPILSEIQEECSDELNIYKVNVDENQKLAEKYSIVSIPCFVSFKNGENYKRIVGAHPKEQIIELAR